MSRAGREVVRVGVAERIVTHKVGQRLAGYSSQRKSTGIHDDVTARCVVIERGETVVALLSVAVCSVEAPLTRAIRRAAHAQTSIPVRNILVHATHTHSAPVVSGRYRAFLEKECAACIVEAWRRRAVGRLGVGMTRVSGCGKNRRYLDYGGLPVDPDVGVIKLEDANGKLRAVLFNYACHGTTMGPHSTLISEDWPYFAIQAIRRKKGRNVVGLFFNGAAGDINPGYSAGLSAVSAEIPVRTWQEAARIGETVGGAVLKSLGGIRTSATPVLSSLTGFVDLPLRQTYPVSLARSEKDLVKARESLRRLQASDKGRYQRSVERARVDVFFAELVRGGAEAFYAGKWPATVRAELQTIRLSDAVITTFPGEVFVEAGLALKEQAGIDKLMIVELANATQARGYLPTRNAYAEGDYEVYSSRYDESAAETLVAASVEQVRAVTQG